MKKIVALGAIAALAGGMIFADEPAIDIKVAEFTGDASVSWGMDLDAGQHGFTNSETAKMKINLWNEGTKEASGDGTVWAELKIKGAGKDVAQDATTFPIPSASLETAKLHFGDNFYIDIRSGDILANDAYKPDSAVHGTEFNWFVNRSGDAATGVADFSNGIEAGWDQDEFKFALDFRSYKAKKTDKTSAYGIKLAAELKDKLVAGLTAGGSLSYNLSTDWKDCTDPTIAAKVTDENASIEDHKANIYDKDDNPTTNLFGSQKDYHQLAYAVQAAYKIGVGDDMFVKPSVGFRGSNSTWKNAADKAASKLENELAAGVLFGWGDAVDDAGVPYIGGVAKKATPGVGVVAYIPLPTVEKFDDDNDTTTTYNALKAMIVPSFYLGNKVSNLSAAAYAEIGLFNFQKPADKYAAASNDDYVLESCDDSTLKNKVWKGIVNENETTAIAFAAGIAYKIELNDGQTVTPKAGFRYANSAYVANKLEAKYSDVFQNLGMQKKAKPEDKKTYAGDFFNLSAGVDFAGFVNNTTFFANYASANLINGIAKEDSTPAYADKAKYYNVKLGTLDVGCKISF